MKYLLVLLVVVVVLWLMLRGREASVSSPRRRGRGRAAPQAMVVCAHCGVHLPGTEALTDSRGLAYCSDAHRLAGPR
jgi:uncharacterized protein